MSYSSALPLYIQISEGLIRDIQAGRLIAGERLAPERQMAAELGISVGTLRKALADLEDKGMLERRQGSGNYVREMSEATGVYAFFRLELPGGGGLPTAETLAVERQRKPAGTPAFGSSDDAFRIRRMRSLGARPVALEEIWLDASAAPKLAAEDLPDSLYYFYRVDLGIWIGRIEDRVGVGQVPEWAPPAFGMHQNSICGFVERVAWRRQSDPIEYSRTWFDHDNCRYVSRLR